MDGRTLSALVAVSLLLASVLRADDAAKPPSPGSASDQRLQYMLDLIDEFQLVRPGGESVGITRSPEPLLRYSNPVRDFLSDGCTFLWLERERPVAVTSLSVRGNGKVLHELTSLTHGPLDYRRNGASVWRPQSSGLLREGFPQNPKVPAMPALRLVMMRRLAHRFHVEILRDPDSPVEARLLPQPIYRFEAPSDGTLDAGLFSCSEATDPEALILIEAIQSGDGAPAWYYSLVRTTSQPAVYYLDEQEVWAVRGDWSHPRSPEDPYVEQFLETYPESGS